jgi:hypothetical protein
MVAEDVPFGVSAEGRALHLWFGEPEEGSPRGRSLLAAAPKSEAPPPAPIPGDPDRPAFAALRDAKEPLTVVVEAAEPRALLRIRGGGAGLDEARVRREGGEVIVTFDLGAYAVPPSPAATPPMDNVHVEKVATLAMIHVKVAPEVPFEVKRDPGALTLTFGEEASLDKVGPAPAPPPLENTDVTSLVSPEIYRGLFPPSLGQDDDQQGPAPTSDVAREGLQLGPVHLRPTILTSYIQGDYTLLDTPTPVTDRYLQIEPRVAADVPLFGGELVADYAVRFRFFSDFEEINTTSHLLNAALDVPLGSRARVRLSDHFSTGTLESTEVDPGQEYFFDLSRFKRNDVELGARVEMGARIFLDGVVSHNDVHFDDPQGFFPYSADTARVGAGMTFDGNLRAAVNYTYDRIPPPDTRTLDRPATTVRRPGKLSTEMLTERSGDR